MNVPKPLPKIAATGPRMVPLTKDCQVGEKLLQIRVALQSGAYSSCYRDNDLVLWVFHSTVTIHTGKTNYI